jgi:hypothetical protein
VIFGGDGDFEKIGGNLILNSHLPVACVYAPQVSIKVILDVYGSKVYVSERTYLGHSKKNGILGHSFYDWLD